ncbi:hypothetical protein WH52_12705 [Tenacibaculum holothuriorum]|uniref:PD-(D/E)XK endonuclease-like domain-containing protein n=1 Tax=Tenacibaculum holothuriorum TaxID=1635173 RepID=A0A1Y2P9K0_9FLAO|nr:PD-(D/E)XK nuclease family protein [Tenacibaculum holothuriorum]OSY87123.1 hypothetical protein WH52_12705 [Tenacibaculum holothuriorum]
MQTFISETIKAIAKTQKSFENVVLVLPSQRARVFVKDALKEEIQQGFLPEIVNIESFVEQVSGVNKIDSVQLLFHFYSIYTSIEENPDSFDVFSSWAITVLQDFNELDQHLVNTKDIFIYLRDIHRLRKWSVKGTFQETELIKDYFSFIEKLNEYYDAFYSFLIEKQVGYQGVLYREAVKKVTDFIDANKNKKYYFIGFNALNKAEEFLFQRMLEAEIADAYWDIDKAFYESNHQAGFFIRKYKTRWKYYQSNEIKTVEGWFSKDKTIQVIGASKNITQLKYAGELLEKQDNFENTALVLADETLLPITLNSLPKKVEAVNITMGYPLKNIPTTNLVLSIFQLFLSQEKLNQKEENNFYYKDVLRLLKDASIYKVLLVNEESLTDSISQKIVKENNTFVNQKFLEECLGKLPTETKEIIVNIFNRITTVSEFIERILSLLFYLKEGANELEKEYLFRFYTTFTQLQNLDKEFGYIKDLKTLNQFFKQLISSENLSFQGEPLKGLQLMGLLETRVLDFENVILTSVNEGILPASNSQNTFIPFDVKLAFELPTYKEKDALFSYHFFRLLQRAKNISILYNTEHDVYGSGEKSRFVTQLQMMKENALEQIVVPKGISSKEELKEIHKNEAVLEKLKELAEKGISPSTLTNYLYNPIAFYKQKVLKIKELEDVEETVAVNTMGTVVHDTLEQLFKPFERKNIVYNDILGMEKEVQDLVTVYFKKHFKNGGITTGKNRLIFEVAKRYVQNYLNHEKKILKDPKNTLRIIATEQKLEADIKVDGIDYPIKIRGIVDRIDELNGTLRIIDYKTGKVEASNLKVTEFDEEIRAYKYHKAIQVMLYSFLYTSSNHIPENTPIQTGIISFKNLKSGFMPVNFSSSRTADNEVTAERIVTFMEEIKSIILEMYNPEVTFKEPLDLPF